MFSARDSNQFNIRVSLEPGSHVIFNLIYEELLKRRRGVYEQVKYTVFTHTYLYLENFNTELHYY